MDYSKSLHEKMIYNMDRPTGEPPLRLTDDEIKWLADTSKWTEEIATIDEARKIIQFFQPNIPGDLEDNYVVHVYKELNTFAIGATLLQKIYKESIENES